MTADGGIYVNGSTCNQRGPQAVWKANGEKKVHRTAASGPPKTGGRQNERCRAPFPCIKRDKIVHTFEIGSHDRCIRGPLSARQGISAPYWSAAAASSETDGPNVEKKKNDDDDEGGRRRRRYARFSRLGRFFGPSVACDVGRRGEWFYFFFSISFIVRFAMTLDRNL